MGALLLSDKLRPLKRQDILNELKTWLGTPYLHQASVKGRGCDCLGLVRGVWRELYGQEPEKAPPYAPNWAEASGQETLLNAATRHLKLVDEPDVGDVIAFRWRDEFPAKHVGFFVGKQRFIHACEGVSVSEVSYSQWWQRRMVAAFQFPTLRD